MNSNVEAQAARQAEIDREIEARIAAMLRRRRRAIIALVMLLTAGLTYAAWSAYRQASAPQMSAKDHYAAGLQHVQGSDLQAAVTDLKRALLVDPRHADARWELARAYLALGEGSAAEKELRQARLLGREGADLTVAVLRATLLQRRYSDVLVDTIGLDPGEQLAEVRALQGEAYLGLKQVDRAKETYREILRGSPSYLPALSGLARASLGSLALDEARAHIEDMFLIDRDALEGFLLSGTLELARGRFSRAFEAFEIALGKNDAHPESHLGLGRALLALGKLDAVEPHLKRLEQTDARAPEVKYLRALTEFRRGDMLSVRDALHSLFGASPDHEDGLFLMALTSYSQHEYHQAEVSLNRLLMLGPDHIFGRTLLAQVHLALRHPESAIEVLLPAVELAPKDRRVLELLAEAEAQRTGGESPLPAESEKTNLVSSGLPSDRSLTELLTRAYSKSSGAPATDSAPSSPEVSLSMSASPLWGDFLEQTLRSPRCRLLIEFSEQGLYRRECL